MTAGNARVLEQMHKYIGIRQAMARPSPSSTSTPMDIELAEPLPVEVPPPSPSKRTRSQLGANGTPSASPSRASRNGVQSTSPVSPVAPPETNRTVIANLARMSDDVMRAANEKLNVSRFTCDLVRISAFLTVAMLQHPVD